MTPYQIKKSILLKGVKGELVEQIDAEGTGKEVLLRSDEIRQRIIKQDKLKAKEIKPIDDKTELYFDIPKNWEWERFGNLVINYDSKRKPVAKEQRKTENGTYDYYGATGAIDKVDEYIFDGEYLMIGEDGGNFFVDRDNSFVANGQFWANNHVHVVKPALCDIYYLKYYLDCLNLPGLGLINGIAVPKLNQENLNSIVIPVPPLEEQHRIVAKIEELLPFVDRYAEAYEKLEQFNAKFPEDMKKSILQYAIMGKLVEQRPEEGSAEDLYKQIQEEKSKLIKEGKIKKEKPLADITEDEIPFDIPENWKWVRFAEFGSYKKGPFGSALTKSMFVPKGENTIKVYEQKNAIQKDATLGEYYITKEYYEDSMSSFEVCPGDVIVSCAGTIGETYVMPESIEKGIINQALMRMKLMPSVYKPYFLMFFDVVLKKNAIKSSKGSAIKNIPPFDELKSYLVPLPPLEEQKRIVAKIEELLPYCDQLIK